MLYRRQGVTFGSILYELHNEEIFMSLFSLHLKLLRSIYMYIIYL
jgi:hypothetical protein